MRTLILTLALALPMACMARLTALDAFRSAPVAVVCELGKTERLDLEDYFNAGLTDRTVTTRAGGEARITFLEPMRIELEGGEAQRLAIVLLPARQDTLIGVVETLLTPAPDSQLKVYNRQWQPVAGAWTAPEAKEWGRHEAKFLLTEYAVSGDTLRLTDRTAQWDAENAPKVKELLYIWTPKKSKFVKLK